MNIGDRQPDGTVYAGISPDTGKDMFALPADAPLKKSFLFAQRYAADACDANGKKGFRLPSKGELNVLFNHRAAIGGFDLSGKDPAGWYWSSTVPWGQRFSDGAQAFMDPVLTIATRCVR